MRKLFFLVFIISSHISYSQIRLSEMIKVYEMDYDQFETFAISKGFEFDGFVERGSINGVSYLKGVEKNTKYFFLYNLYEDLGVSVEYQTSSQNEILYIKNELKNLGFTLKLSEPYTNEYGEEFLKKYYANKIWKVNIYSGQGGKFVVFLNKIN